MEEEEDVTTVGIQNVESETFQDLLEFSSLIKTRKKNSSIYLKAVSYFKFIF